MGRKLISSDESITADVQHESPCSDCPFARKSLPGWLGPYSAPEWVRIAQGDEPIPCHVISNQQCAGAAIFRRNLCKLPRNPKCLRLERDVETVFRSIVEFTEHHH